METTIDRFGRIVLPKQLRDHLGLHPGATLRVEEGRGHLTLTPLPVSPLLERQGGVLIVVGRTTGDVERLVQDHREARARKLTGLEPR